MIGPFTTESHDTIDAIDADAWDAIAPDHPMTSHGWLRTVERTSAANLEPRYIVARDTSGAVRGATVCYAPDPTDAAFTFDHLMFGRGRGIARATGLSFLPVTDCRPFESHGAHVWTDAALEPAGAAYCRELLIDSLETAAEARGTGVAFSCVTAEERELASVLRSRGYRGGRHFPTCALDVRWKSFDEYLAHIARARPRLARTIRRERKRVRDGGVRITRITDAAPHARSLHTLASMNMEARAGRPFAYEPAFFTELVATMGESAWLYGAFRDRELVGFSLMLERRGLAVVYVMGIDPDRPKRDLLYFVLSYDRPIEDAIARGFRHMHFGGTHYELKARRGCRTIPTGYFYRPPGGVRNVLASLWLPVHSFWIARKNREADRFGRDEAPD